MLIKKVAFSIIILAALASALGWQVGEFSFFATQNCQMFFQSWIAISGTIFAIVMAITSLILYKKTKITSMQASMANFLLIAAAFIFSGYHTSYCKVCSDLTLCGASHNYSNYLILVALLV